MHHIDDRFVPASVRAVIDQADDAAELRRWMRAAEQERQRVIDNEDEPNRDSRIEMLNSEIHYLQQRIYHIKIKQQV